MKRTKRRTTWMMATIIGAAVWPVGAGAHDDHDHPPAPAATRATDGHRHDEDAGHDAHADEVTLTPQAIQRHGIQVRPVRRQALSGTFTAPGRVSYNAEAMAHVGSVLTGRIVELPAKLGAIVAKGDVLLVIESPELVAAQSEYLRERTAVAVAEKGVGPAKETYERAQGLYDQSRGIALGEVRRRQAEWTAADGALATALVALAAAENKLRAMGVDQNALETLAKTGAVDSRASVRAPIDGQVIEREVTLGELVRPDRDALLILANTQRLWVIAHVPEARLAELRQGTTAQVRLAAMGERTFAGTVTHIAPALDDRTRTVAVRVELPNPDGALRPGMFARVELSSGSGETALLVPEEAVQSVEGEPSVFVPVEGEANTFARRAVTIGRPVGGMVPVLTRLADGEPVVVSGTFILKAELGKGGAGHEH